MHQEGELHTLSTLTEKYNITNLSNFPNHKVAKRNQVKPQKGKLKFDLKCIIDPLRLGAKILQY
jgi:hypothetical protein